MNEEVLEYVRIEQQILNFTQDVLIYRSPKDTYNLANHGIVRKGNQLIIGNQQVPYAVITNAETIKGRPNRNAKWVDNGVLQAMRIYASQYGYRVVVE